jgi:hypothetical protein
MEPGRKGRATRLAVNRRLVILPSFGTVAGRKPDAAVSGRQNRADFPTCEALLRGESLQWLHRETGRDLHP